MVLLLSILLFPELIPTLLNLALDTKGNCFSLFSGLHSSGFFFSLLNSVFFLFGEFFS